MISYKCDIKQAYEIKLLNNMEFAEVLQAECDFKVFISNELYYDDVVFPVLEFVKYCLKWLADPNGDFVYHTVGSEENPHLAFY